MLIVQNWRDAKHVSLQQLEPYCSDCLWPPCVADADIIFSSCGFFYFSSSFFLT